MKNEEEKIMIILNEYYNLNDELHREDGPAVEYVDGTLEWWLNGEEFTEEEFNSRN